MESQPTGTSVVNDPMYQEGQALKYSSSGVTAIETVTVPPIQAYTTWSYWPVLHSRVARPGLG